MEQLSTSNWIEKFTCLGMNVTKKTILLNVFLIFVALTPNTSCNVPRFGGEKVDVSGNWQITISVAEGTIIGKGSLLQKGDVVTGWVGPSENDPIPITGKFKKGRLIIKTIPQPGRTVAFDKVDLKVNVDMMSGAIENGSLGKGTIKFIRSK